jgi:hypothetical protein
VNRSSGIAVHDFFFFFFFENTLILVFELYQYLQLSVSTLIFNNRVFNLLKITESNTKTDVYQGESYFSVKQ